MHFPHWRDRGETNNKARMISRHSINGCREENNVRLLILRLLAFSVALATSAYAAEPSVPRMWKVVGPSGERMFVLGISHYGSRLEYDAYLRDVVIPAFSQADVLHFEDGGNAYGNQQIECATPLLEPGAKATVHEARSIVQRDAVEYFRRILKDLPSGPPSEKSLEDDARTFANGLSEFSLLTVLKQQYEFLQPPAHVGVDALGGGPVVQELLRLRPDLPTQSMDAPDDLALAYCASAVRLELLKMHVDSYNRNSPLPQATEQEALRQADQQVHDIFVEHRSTPGLFGDAFICPRNEMWMTRLPAMRDGRVHFLALGGAHLFPYRGASRQCEGLLSDLQRAGYRVTTVKRAVDDRE